MTNRLNYSNKVILAPMVRMNTLPLRLLSLDYGADIVYSEEIVDRRILRCRRVVNEILKTVDYIDECEGSVVFRTSAQEKSRLVFQVGTSCPKLAVATGKFVENDVAGFDVNMGCPKDFSLKGGMGAALLTQPEKVKEILTSLVENLSIPVTCKVRLLPNLEDTLELCKMIESCGVAALAVHGRTKEERSRQANNDSAIRAIAETLKIPVIANGGSNVIQSYADVEQFRKTTGASSVMLARAAQWNCSIFRPGQEHLLPVDEVIKEYLKYAVAYDNVFGNTKYCVQNMLRAQQESTKGQLLLKATNIDEICELWDLGSYNVAKQDELRRISAELQMKLPCRGEALPKRLKTEPTFFTRTCDDESVIKMSVRLSKTGFCHTDIPKSILFNYTVRHHIPLPVYHTEQVEKLFYSTVAVAGKQYATDYLERSKRRSEQAAALAALHALKLIPAAETERTSAIESPTAVVVPAHM